MVSFAWWDQRRPHRGGEASIERWVELCKGEEETAFQTEGTACTFLREQQMVSVVDCHTDTAYLAHREIL